MASDVTLTNDENIQSKYISKQLAIRSYLMVVIFKEKSVEIPSLARLPYIPPKSDTISTTIVYLSLVTNGDWT